MLPGARGASAAGLFGIARKISTVPLIVRQAFQYVLAPLASAEARRDRAGLGPLYRFATLTAQGIAVTPAFGSCSDIATATLEKTPDGAPEPQVRMAGSRDPIAALGETAPTPERMQLRRFALRNGAVEAIPATD